VPEGAFQGGADGDQAMRIREVVPPSDAGVTSRIQSRGRSMSLTFSGQLSGQPARRVRHDVRDGMAVIAFSAAASSALAAALMLFLAAVGQAG
jgi:hypothetical protein